MKTLLFVSLTALIVASPVQARHKSHAAKAKPAAAKAAAPAELKWVPAPPGLPAGAEIAVVKGDPGKAGMFTIHLKTPANYSVAPHWHPTDEHVTLVSGKMAYGMSDRLDRLNGQALTAGQSIVMKAKEHHWVFTGDGAEVEVTAMGPFQINYVNPADDPRPKAKPTK
jgi:quercetin dioxygenase-like cupin family protein